MCLGVVICPQDQNYFEKTFGLKSVWDGPGGSQESPGPPYKIFIYPGNLNFVNKFLYIIDCCIAYRIAYCIAY